MITIPEKRSRDIAHAWWDKRILRLFRDKFPNEYKFLKDIYIALCEIDSDFCESKLNGIQNLNKTISSYAGLNIKTVSKFRWILVALGLVEFCQLRDKETFKFNKSTFTLFKYDSNVDYLAQYEKYKKDIESTQGSTTGGSALEGSTDPIIYKNNKLVFFKNDKSGEIDNFDNDVDNENIKEDLISSSPQITDNKNEVEQTNLKPKKEEKENAAKEKEEGKVFIEILSYFNQTCGVNLKLTEQRKQQIRARLKTFTIDEIKYAIASRLKSPFHCGENPDKIIWYDDWYSLFRSDQKIERWIKPQKNNAHKTQTKPPTPLPSQTKNLPPIPPVMPQDIIYPQNNIDLFKNILNNLPNNHNDPN